MLFIHFKNQKETIRHNKDVLSCIANRFKINQTRNRQYKFTTRPNLLHHRHLSARLWSISINCPDPEFQDADLFIHQAFICPQAIQLSILHPAMAKLFFPGQNDRYQNRLYIPSCTRQCHFLQMQKLYRNNTEACLFVQQ